MAPDAGEKLDEGDSSHPMAAAKSYLILAGVIFGSCAGFVGSAVLIGIGYRNLGSAALGILGVGVVLFFVTVVFLVGCGIWMNKEYVDEQPQPDRIRVGRSAEETSPPLLMPSPSGSGLILPVFKDTRRPKGPMDPRLRADRPGKAPLTDYFHDKPVGTSVSDAKYVLAPKEDKHEMDLHPSSSHVRNITTSHGDDPPVDVRIVSSPGKGQETMSDSSGSEITASSTEQGTKVKPVSHHSQAQDPLKETFPTPGSKQIPPMIISTEDPITDVKRSSGQKQNEHHQKKTFAAPNSGKVTSSPAAGPQIDLRIIPHQRQDEHDQAKMPAPVQSNDLLTDPIMDLLSTVKLAPLHEKVWKPQEKRVSLPDSSSGIILSVADAVNDMEYVSHYKMAQGSHTKTSLVSGFRQSTTVQVSGASDNVQPCSETQDQHGQCVSQNYSCCGGATFATSPGIPKQPGFASQPKKNQSNMNNCLNVPISEDFTWSPAGVSSRPDQHHISHTDTGSGPVQATSKLTDRKPEQDRCLQDSKAKRRPAMTKNEEEPKGVRK